MANLIDTVDCANRWAASGPGHLCGAWETRTRSALARIVHPCFRSQDTLWCPPRQPPKELRTLTSGTAAAGTQHIQPFHHTLRLLVNYFQPSWKLPSKLRVGAKVKKRDHKPATPCARLLEHASVADEVKQKLQSERDRLDPLALWQRIRHSQAALAALRSGNLGHQEERESLKQSLAKLPELWRAREARPTHCRPDAPPRAWRTREDPFEGVWSEILLWLPEDPDATALSLLAHVGIGGASRRAVVGRVRR